MGDNIITLSFDKTYKVPLKVGDWCQVYGEKYYLNALPKIKKVSNVLYEYTVVMQAEYYNLQKTNFLGYGLDNELRKVKHSLTGTPDDFVYLLLQNANRNGGGWEKGTVVGGAAQTMTFDSENCLSVLERIAKQFGTEWYVEGKKISLDARQKDRGQTFRFGRNKGLKEINQEDLPDTGIVTRLYARGGNKNIPGDYRDYSDRLLMTGGIDFVEKNAAKYGIIEGSQVFEDIFPRRTGKVTSTFTGSPFIFTDTSIDFDVNAQLLPGLSAKVTFNTGQLAGYTFDIGQFLNGPKTFTILKNKDEKQLDVPSDLLRPEIGDEYVLVDIKMPESYVTAAEAELKAAAESMLNTVSEAQQKFTVITDPIYLRKKKLVITPGDLIWVYDQDLEINRRIRVTGVVRRFEDEYDYNLTLADGVSTSPNKDWDSGISNNSRDISNINDRLNNRSSENNFVGTVILADIKQTSDTSGMFPLYVDASGMVYKKV
jgi:hypothetical protein